MEGYLTAGAENPKRIATFTGEFIEGYFTGKLLTWEAPAHIRAVFAEYEKYVNGQAFVDEGVADQIAAMKISAVLADGRSFRVDDLQIYSGDMGIAFWIGETGQRP
jgi:hypothetical protein